MRDLSDADTMEFPLPVGVDPPVESSSQVRVDVGALSDQGLVRQRNEDHYLVARAGRHLDTLLTNLPSGDVPEHFDETGYVAIVADGMGGVVGGDTASRLAIRSLVNIVLHVPDWILRLDKEHAQKLTERAANYYRQVHAALLEKTRMNPELRGMGTTMTAAYSIGTDLFVCHVGDSRAYLLRNDTLQRLTKDQTQAQQLADAGIIQQEEVAHHRLRNVLTNALGAGVKEVDTKIDQLRLQDGDTLLLCTDGLTDMIEDDAIGKILKDERPAREICRSLVDSALANGGRDNVTVVVARYYIPL